MGVRVWLVCVFYIYMCVCVCVIERKNSTANLKSNHYVHQWSFVGTQRGKSVPSPKQNLPESSFFEISTSNLEPSFFYINCF